jgi:hypothetical protein
MLAIRGERVRGEEGKGLKRFLVYSLRLKHNLVQGRAFRPCNRASRTIFRRNVTLFIKSLSLSLSLSLSVGVMLSDIDRRLAVELFTRFRIPGHIFPARRRSSLSLVRAAL